MIVSHDQSIGIPKPAIERLETGCPALAFKAPVNPLNRRSQVIDIRSTSRARQRHALGSDTDRLEIVDAFPFESGALTPRLHPHARPDAL